MEFHSVASWTCQKQRGRIRPSVFWLWSVYRLVVQIDGSGGSQAGAMRTQHRCHPIRVSQSRHRHTDTHRHTQTQTHRHTQTQTRTHTDTHRQQNTTQHISHTPHPCMTPTPPTYYSLLVLTYRSTFYHILSP